MAFRMNRIKENRELQSAHSANIRQYPSQPFA